MLAVNGRDMHHQILNVSFSSSGRGDIHTSSWWVGLNAGRPGASTWEQVQEEELPRETRRGQSEKEEENHGAETAGSSQKDGASVSSGCCYSLWVLTTLPAGFWVSGKRT